MANFTFSIVQEEKKTPKKKNERQTWKKTACITYIHTPTDKSADEGREGFMNFMRKKKELFRLNLIRNI